jgi:hypothetical protein
MSSNGKLKDDELTPINGSSGSADRLAKGGAAAGWNAMCQKAKQKGLAIPAPGGPDSSYRDYDSQVYYWNLYQSGQGNVAAKPGTSNHGWGTAVDVATTDGVATVKAIGGPYGWAWGEVSSEWWHVTYYGGYSGSNPGPVDQEVVPLQRGDKGSDVHTLQGRLKRLGYHPLKDEYSDSVFGSQTEQIVKRFQLNSGLEVDGIVGHQTYDKIKSRLHTVDRNHLTDNEDHWVDLFYRHHKEQDRLQLVDQRQKIYDLADPDDWDVHDRKIRYDTLGQIANKHDKIHVE